MASLTSTATSAVATVTLTGELRPWAHRGRLQTCRSPNSAPQQASGLEKPPRQHSRDLPPPRCSVTKSARWRRGAPTVTDGKYQTVQQPEAAAVKVLDLDPCERSVTRRATQPKGRKGRRPWRRERCESPKAQRCGGIVDAIPPAQILHHPEKQVAVADPGRNHHANRHEAVCEMRMDNPSPREACVGLPSRPTWAEKRKNGERQARGCASAGFGL